MTIIHKIDDFLFSIFPDVNRDDVTMLNSFFVNFYTFGAIKPKVSIKGEYAIIDIDVPVIDSEISDFNQVIRFCERGEFVKAKPILTSLITRNPSNSEYHRIMGQIISEEGDQDGAINFLIDALRWDSKNHWALVMMGNIFAKYKNDLTTAQKYYDQAVVVNPKDNITVNNIGANLLQQGKIEEAKKYFWEAVKINPNYPNTHYALGMVAEMENDLHSAFFSSCQALKLCAERDPLYQHALKQAISIAEKIVPGKSGMKEVDRFRDELEKAGNMSIDFATDGSIPTAAKLEIAENYNRNHHQVLYQPNSIAVEHLIAHELVHLHFVYEARNVNLNQLFISNQQHRSNFIKTIDTTLNKLKKSGIDKDSVTRYANELFDGINLQIYNTPIDLFIEDFISTEFPDLRPYQFLSLLKLVSDGLNAVTDKRSIELSPPSILSKSKILNIVNALQLKDLYGVDLVDRFKSSNIEMKQAQGFYDEYKEYKDDREPAEEYELINHWATDLKLTDNFEMVDEEVYRKAQRSPESVIASIESDPYDMDSNDPQKQKEMDLFLKAHENATENMAVVMYMVDAFNYFHNMPMDKIRGIAYDIALAGTLGFHPDKENYNIKSIPGKLFTGYHILAYYYVSWMLSQPEMVPKLQLPFEKEYKIAKGFIQRQDNG